MKYTVFLGMDFMEQHKVDFQAAEKKLFIGNRPVTVFNQRGAQLNHRIVSRETVYAPPHQRFIITGRITGLGEIEDTEVMFEGSKALFAQQGVLAPRVLVVPRHNMVPVEVINMTDESRTIEQGTTLGVVNTATDLCSINNEEPWEQ